MPYPLPLCDDITLPHKSSLSAHNSMYRRRAKLRDVLSVNSLRLGNPTRKSDGMRLNTP